ncbi:MAG: dTMP kinase [Phycisphaerae bacterium]|nr:dTMP kinase [Phycisphaerae bacterium]NUQ46332.1 dTMP kinase [Phycisphaerae bacterium]
MVPLPERLRGKFIVFDGPDGGGKSTQIERVVRLLDGHGVPVARAKDPGGTPIGDRIRHVLLDFDLSEMDVRCETLLFMASRAQLVGRVIEPALRRGEAVICDRFVSATCAYQGAAGYDMGQIIELARFAIGRTWPDVTIVVDVPPELGFQRTGRPVGAGRSSVRENGQRMIFHDAHVDAMEARPLAFHRRVRTLFTELGNVYPRPVRVVDGTADVEVVHQRVLEALDSVLSTAGLE